MKKRCMQCMNELNESMVCGVCQFDNASEMNPAHALPMESLLNGKYLIGKVIGEGGFGITYIAWDTLIETVVAIKEYYPAKLVSRNTTMQGNEESCSMEKSLTILSGEYEQAGYKKGLEKFADEAARLAKFNQMPGVVSVKDFFYENNTAYMVMEYIHGVTLKAYLAWKKEKMNPGTVFQIMKPVIKTLEEIHKQGVIHRDISPDNIMITQDGQLKLIDFGAARFIDANDEKSLTVILKHGYAPEEQYRSNGKQGPWTDVYALCAVIYRMIFGEVPSDVAQRMIESEDLVLKQIKGEKTLNGQEKSALLKGLAVKTEKRYQSMAGLYSGLYGKKNVWPVVAAGILAVAVIGGCFILFGDNRKTTEDEGTLVVQVESIEESGLEEECITETESGVETEPGSYYDLYSQMYNERYCHLNNNRYFMDLNGDGIDEMIIKYIKNQEMDVYSDNIGSGALIGVDIWCLYGESIKKIFAEEVICDFSMGINYYLANYEGDINIIRERWESVQNEEGVNTCKSISYDLLSLDVDTMSYEWNTVELNEGRDNLAIILWSTSYLYDYSYDTNNYIEKSKIGEEKQYLHDMIEIAIQKQQSILDYEIVEENEYKGLFLTLATFDEDKRRLLDNKVSVYYYDYQDLIHVSDITMGIDEYTSYNIDNFEIFQFGNCKHYAVNTKLGGSGKQYKFGCRQGIPMEIMDNNTLINGENGRVTINLSRNAEIYYYDNQYVEFGCKETDELKLFDNYTQIIKEIENDMKEDEDDTAELKQVITSGAGYYYLNFFINNKDWKYAIVSDNNGILVYEEAHWGKRLVRAASTLPLYFRDRKDLVEACVTTSEMEKMVSDKCATIDTYNVYDDFDNNYSNEMFVYCRTEMGMGYPIQTSDRGCSIWYCDGEQAFLLIELQEGYSYDGMEVEYIDDKLYCVLRRRSPYDEMEITYCSVENGIPYVKK